MKNMKIGIRLGLSFGVVCLLLIGVLVLGISSLGNLNEESEKIVHDRYPKVVLSYSTIGELNQIARSMRNIVIFSEPQMVRKELDRIETAKARIKENLDKLDKHITSAKGKELLKATLDAREKYRVHQEQFLKLAGEGKKDDAKNLLLTQLRPAQLAYMEALGALISYQGELMEASGKDAANEYHNSRTLMLALGGVAILLAAVIATWMTLSITRPLGQAVAAANKLRDGDLQIAIDVTSKDETGQLLSAMQAMVAKLTRVIEGQARVVEAANHGKFDVRIELAGLQGFQKEMAEGLNQLAATIGAAIDDVVRVTSAMAEGDLSKKIDKSYEGEFGRLKEYVNTMVESTSASINDVVRVMGAMAEGDLSKKIEQDYRGEFSKLREYANSTVDKLAQVVAEVNSAADAIAGASEEVSATAQALSQAASEQAAGVEETSASIEQMTASISQNTENANASSSEELAATAEEMSSQAEQLQQLMSFFKLRHDQGAPVVVAAKAHKVNALRKNATKANGSHVTAGADAPDEAHFTRF